MMYTHVAVEAAAARRNRVEMSAYDLAGDDEYPHKGKRGGQYKLVNGRKVYKPGGGGAKPAAKPRPSKAAPAGRQEAVARLSGQLKDLYAVVSQDSVGYGAIDEMVTALGKLSRDEVAEAASGIGIKLNKGVAKKLIVEKIKHHLEARKGSSQRVQISERPEKSGQPVESGSMDRAAKVQRLGQQLKDLYAIVHEETTGYGAIDEMADALGRLSRDEVAQVAKDFNLAFRKGASKKAIVGQIKRKLTEQKAIAQRIGVIRAN